jgi:UDP-N-acetyl-2-amino-2-deoxyglucuronate dehydrogenase
MDDLRIAILGVGWAGAKHVEAIRELGRGLVVDCLVDGDPDFLAQQCGELRIEKAYVRSEEALDDGDVDAVSICLPHQFHCDVAVEAAKAGKHVLVEKPMAMTVDEATRMIEAANEYDVKLYVAENRPYHPMSLHLREIVQSGDPIGEVISASMVTGFRSESYGYPGRRSWLGNPREGGSGQWLLNGIHDVAQLRSIFGEMTDIYMREHHASNDATPEVEGTMVGQMTSADGYQVSIMQSRELHVKGGLRGITIYGNQGTIRTTDTGYDVYGADGLESSHTWPTPSMSDYALEMDAFVRYVREGEVGPTSAESERKSLAIVQAGYESAASGEVVSLQARFGEL